MKQGTPQKLANGKLLLTHEGAIARITFNKPERMNAMCLDMWAGLKSALTELAKLDSVRVVVLAGAGEKAFVSGADISEFDQLRATEEGVRTYNAVSEAADDALYNFPKPTIAEIKGYCVGGGMGLAIGCDLRVCSDDARLGITAARLGLGYNYEGVRRLVDLAGPAVAARILYTAELFPAAKAQSLGLVDEVVLRTDLTTTVASMAERMSLNAPLTQRAAKAAIRSICQDQGASKGDVDKLVADCFASQDYAEGRLAFAEKRRPVFIGK